MAVGSDKYVGVDKDINGGMTHFGKAIRDAWVFGILPEGETCEGWAFSRIEVVINQVNDEWDKYGCLVSGLPDDLKQRHKLIHDKAIEIARAAGWSGEQEVSKES